MSESGSTQIAIRLADEDLELADEIAGRFGSMGFTKSRSEVLRAAIKQGLVVLEDRLPKASQPAGAKRRKKARRS